MLLTLALKSSSLEIVVLTELESIMKWPSDSMMAITYELLVQENFRAVSCDKITLLVVVDSIEHEYVMFICQVH